MVKGWVVGGRVEGWLVGPWVALQSMKAQILKRSLGTAPKTIARQDKSKMGVFISQWQNDLKFGGFKCYFQHLKSVTHVFKVRIGLGKLSKMGNGHIISHNKISFYVDIC